MEIRRWQIYVFISCVFVTHLVAKPVSLNELIAAENKQKEKSQHTKPTAAKKPKTVSLNELTAAESQPKVIKSPSSNTTGRSHMSGVASTPKKFSPAESSPSKYRQNLEKNHFPKILGKKPRRKLFSLKDLFTTEKSPAKRRIETFLSKSSGAGFFPRRGKLFPSLSHKLFESEENIFSLGKTISPLKFRRKFEIYSPLKPKKIKYSFTPRLKRRNQSSKREATEDEVFNHRHIPLIKRIGLLVDDILSPYSSESIEPSVRRRKPRRNQKLSESRPANVDLSSSESKPQKTTVVAPTTVSPTTAETEDTTTETPDTTAYTTPPGDVYTLRPDPDLPLPSARNTSSHWRNDHGIGEGSGAAFHRDIERHITGYNRSDEYNPSGRKQTYSSSHEEDPRSSTRIDKCGDGSRNNTRYSNDIHETEETKISIANRFVGRNDTEGKNTFQVGGQEALQIPRDVRLRGLVPNNKVFIVDAESLPPEKPREESVINVTDDHTSAERGTARNGAVASKNQGLRQVIQGMIPIDDLLHPNFLKERQNNQLVTIFDGYSVARDINGRNKLTEKSIRISPN